MHAVFWRDIYLHCQLDRVRRKVTRRSENGILRIIGHHPVVTVFPTENHYFVSMIFNTAQLKESEIKHFNAHIRLFKKRSAMMTMHANVPHYNWECEVPFAKASGEPSESPTKPWVEEWPVCANGERRSWRFPSLLVVVLPTIWTWN